MVVKLQKFTVQIFILILFSSFALAELECVVQQGICGGNGTKILGMSNYTNAHVELPTNSSPDHNYSLCCKDNESVNSVNTNCGTILLRLSNFTDAHASEIYYPDYPYTACIGSDTASISCSYTEGSCSSGTTCVLTVNESMPSYPNTNMHTAGCLSSPYDKKLCCGFVGCIDNDADGWGAEGSILSACNYTSSYDCNDSNANIHPSAYDIPNNGIDEDCTGTDASANYSAVIYFEQDYLIDGAWGWHIGDDVGYQLNFLKNNISSDEDVDDIMVELRDCQGNIIKTQYISQMIHPNAGNWTGFFTTDDIGSQHDNLLQVKAYFYNSEDVLLDDTSHNDEVFLSGTAPSFSSSSYTYLTSALSNYTVKDFYVNSSLAIINWSGTKLDLHTRDINLDSALTMGDKSVYLDSASYSELNKPATLTFENVDCSSPYIYYSETASSRAEILAENNQCLYPRCSNIQCSRGIMTVDVSSFSGYAAEGNANLSIDTDDPKNIFEEVHFTADYRNSTGGSFISGANCTIYFTGGSYDMAEGAGIYTYNKTFSTSGVKEYNITCSKAGWNTLTAFDNATITDISSIPEFSIFTLMLGFAAVIGGLFIIRRLK